MFRFMYSMLFLVFAVCFANAQADTVSPTDTLKTVTLQEVVVIAQQSASDANPKALANIETYLEKAGSVNMLRRGPYAWEPLLNGMATERSVVTVDGMRIYGACTDKMDPVTSYVEITNLAKANVHSGQSGSTGGATIAGTMDLVRRKTGFGDEPFKGSVFSGFESNNHQKIVGTSLSHSGKRLFTDVNFMYRDAENYKAGGGEEILYSPFTKYNLSAIAGYKLNDHQHIEASVIYDHAVDVGYPALPMDVALAKAWITSLEYVRHHISPKIQQWKTKVYYNDVTHVMDDTKRPVVPIRMDMPGWSKTAGFYSLLEGGVDKHTWKASVSGHHNYSRAEMTMFSNTTGEKDMFMLTWPGVATNYVDLFAEDSYSVSENWITKLSLGLGAHNNQIDNQFGLESLQIFYPDMAKSKTRVLPRVAASAQYQTKAWQYVAGVAYGERAPSVSEGFGFYLFNSFDRFDYIGNPEMKNEKSIELNSGISYAYSQGSVKVTGAYFHLRDYIIGRPDPDLSVMTIGASGVKIYEQVDHAQIFNGTLEAKYQVSENWLLSGNMAYRRGTGSGVGNLPLMQPFAFSAGLMYAIDAFTAETNFVGAAEQRNYNAELGETPAPAYGIFNLSASYQFSLGQHALTLKTGAENVFDKYYSTFADWNRIPRMGRNVFVNLIWNF